MIYFTEDEIEKEINKVLLEEDDMVFITNHIIGSGKNFKLIGQAIIEEEIYNDFEIILETTKEILETNATNIMLAEWLWYDYSL